MKNKFLPLFGIAILLFGCQTDPVPKPRGYFRIDLPAKEYRTFAPPCNFSFEVPKDALILPSRNASDSCWLDIHMPGYKQTIHFTYKEVGDQLFQMIDDAHGFKSKHQVKADQIDHIRVINEQARVFGTIFNIEGPVASPMQFYLTDSTDHFAYGAMYFNLAPNTDSLAPVIQRSKENLQHLVESFRWADSGGQHATN